MFESTATPAVKQAIARAHSQRGEVLRKTWARIFHTRASR